ncbi:multiple sugar transport system substrate-binding protein [Alkalibacterium putridalgicola]|uniref:ABC transporter substrate-binding protein n=1 Tax=Alkalibacterium putridalgicola TaxID=426703 RepID=A0A1H7TIL7_9LACT|nr:ABC transporter substrate-binding protein [Alkalibacterium putridalgicola]GEK89476.1 ABC transporter substrate-binding protein [Alkalibacterium putridalgicola]SEL84186.1 multiple sugar transport system substrate-binding protein [Alkalibacterium putridalgicola]
MSTIAWKKHIKRGLILTSTPLILAACADDAESDPAGEDTPDTEENAGSENSGETVQLEFWSFWGSGPRRETIEAIIEDFNNENDNIEVEYVYQPWGDIWTKSLAAIAGGNAPDVIVQDINSVRQRAEAEQATNLQQFIEDDSFSENFYPQLWDTVIYEDEAYAVPFNTDTQVIFYNKDAFEEAGLDPESPPTTWAELEEDARALDIQSGDDWEQIGFYPRWNIGPDVWALNADEGVSWFDDEGNVTINTPEKVAALEWMLEQQDHYGRDTINQFEAEFGSGVADPFISGLVAMRGQNLNYYTNLRENAPEDLNYGVFRLPEYEEGSGHWTWGGGFVLEIPENTENPEASFEFLQYLTSTEVQERFGMNSFDIMANIEANENLTSHPDLEEQGQEMYQMAQESLETTVITPVPLTAPDYIPLVNAEIDAAFLGEKTAQEALDAAQESVENLVEQNQ